MLPDEIPGWDAGIAELYHEIAQTCTSEDTLVELGVWMGRSLARLAGYCRELGKKPRIVGIDAWDARGLPPEERATEAALSGKLRELTARNLRQCGVLDMVELLEGETSAAAAGFADGSVTMVMVDAGHEYEGVCADLRAWLPKIRPGGLICGHDSTAPGVRRAVRELVPGAWASNLVWRRPCVAAPGFYLLH